MKRWITGMVSGLVAAAVVVAGAELARAQGGGAGRSWDAKTVETVSGEVVEVQQVPSPRGKGNGVHLVVRTEAVPSLGVRLGPAWYVDRQQVKIAKGDHVEVKGSRVTIDGQSVLLAAEVKKGDQTLVLRDANGVPAWGGRGGRKRSRRAPASG